MKALKSCIMLVAALVAASLASASQPTVSLHLDHSYGYVTGYYVGDITITLTDQGGEQVLTTSTVYDQDAGWDAQTGATRVGSTLQLQCYPFYWYYAAYNNGHPVTIYARTATHVYAIPYLVKW